MEIKKLGWAFMMCAAIAMGSLMSSCSSDDNGDDNGGTDIKDPEVTYKGSTAYSTGLLFNNGTEIGNGAQNFHLTGTVRLEKGTYLLKGWVYVDVLASNSSSHIVRGNEQKNAELKEGDIIIISGNLNLANDSNVEVKTKK